MAKTAVEPPVAEPPAIEVATFRAAVKKFHIDDQGRLNLLLQVPPEFKADGFETTNYPGTMLTFAATRRPRASELDDDDEPA